MAGQCILLVEDEFLVRATLVEALAEDGFLVLEAATADEAAALLEREVSIGLLITDLQLPGRLDGRALAERVRTLRPDLPVIFTTGRGEAMGPVPPGRRELFFAKPYLPSELCTAARRLLSPPE